MRGDACDAAAQPAQRTGRTHGDPRFVIPTRQGVASIARLSELGSEAVRPLDSAALETLQDRGW